MLGGGRIETLVTELMVTLGGERRSAALTGLVNLLLPLIAFVLAMCVLTELHGDIVLACRERAMLIFDEVFVNELVVNSFDRSRLHSSPERS